MMSIAELGYSFSHVASRDTRRLSAVPTGETIQDPFVHEQSNRNHAYQQAETVVMQSNHASREQATSVISNLNGYSNFFTSEQESSYGQQELMALRSLSCPSQGERVSNDMISAGSNPIKSHKPKIKRETIQNSELNRCSTKRVVKSVTSNGFQSSPKLSNSVTPETSQVNTSSITSSSVPVITESANNSESQKSTSWTKKTVNKKSPIYYVNFGETQTEVQIIPLMSGQGTQTSFGAGMNSPTVNKSGNGRKQVNSSTAIQTRCSINPSGRKNDPALKSKKSSSCQTNGNRRQAKRSLNSASVQTDIPKKRKRIEDEPVAEAESQTTPDKVTTSCSVDLQTNLSFETPCHTNRLILTENTPERNQVIDWYSSYNDMPSAIQTETQTLPFDLTEFFDTDFPAANGTDSVSPERQAVHGTVASETGYFVSPRRVDSRILDEAAVETQTPWPDIFSNDLNSDQSFNRHWLDQTPPGYVTFSEGTQTVGLPDDLASIDFSLL